MKPGKLRRPTVRRAATMLALSACVAGPAAAQSASDASHWGVAAGFVPAWNAF